MGQVSDYLAQGKKLEIQRGENQSIIGIIRGGNQSIIGIIW